MGRLKEGIQDQDQSQKRSCLFSGLEHTKTGDVKRKLSVPDKERVIEYKKYIFEEKCVCLTVNF